MVVHFLHPYGLSTKCTLFKCHKHIVKSSIWQKNYVLRLPIWIKNNIKGGKFNKHTPTIQQSTFKVDIWIIIWVLHWHSNAFSLWFHLNIFYRDSIYDIWWKKYIWIEKKYNKNSNQQITMDFWIWALFSKVPISVIFP